MGGRLQDAWKFAWPEIWLRLEDIGGVSLDIYQDLYVELVKAYRKAPQPNVFEDFANNPLLAREALEFSSADELRGEGPIARFFEDAHDVLAETGSTELPANYESLLATFLDSRNLRYHLAKPFQLVPNVSGVFSAVLSDVMKKLQDDPDLIEATSEFEHAFRALTRSHAGPDMKTCIQKAAMLVEAIASAYPEAKGDTLGELCDSIKCWPHSAVKEALKKIYGFCSDYPGIRHNVKRAGRIRQLEMRDSIILPLLLLTASGYFASNSDLMDTLRSQASEVPQLPPDPPLIDPNNPSPNLP
jgi:hypothetical protein